MGVEIREMVVRTTISGGAAPEQRESASCHSLEEVTREVLAICLERLADCLEKQKER